MSIVNLTEQYEKNKNLIELVSKKSGEDLTKCYQCGKCSAGCPAADAMDYRPNRIIRMIQLGLMDQVLTSRAIWVCATCSTCTARCPRNVDLARLMDTLRIMSYKMGKTSAVKGEVNFHDCFNKSVSRWGRVYELGLVIGLKLGGTGKLLDDAELGLPMFTKGKLDLLPTKIKGVKDIQRIGEAIERMEGES